MARRYKFWTQSEIAVLKAGLMPEGRSYHACVLFCSRLGIKFPGIETFDYNKRLLEKHKNGTPTPGGTPAG